MPDLFTQLAAWKIGAGYKSAIMRGMAGAHMAKGSFNAMVRNSGLVSAFRGVTLVAVKIGSRLLFPIDEAYAGLGLDLTPVNGSVFQVRELLMYVGNGDIAFNGVGLGVSASSTLSYVKKVGSAYPGPPYQAGRAQPSAPVLYAKDNPSAGQTAMSGAVAVVIWRVSSIDGQPSLMSLPSNVVILSGQSAIVQFPLPDANGQDLWGIGVSKVGFLDLGAFYELPISLSGEVAESSFGYTRNLGATDVIVEVVTDATNATPIVITSVAHALITGDSVIIAGVTGNLAANGTWVITVIDADTYSLNTSVGTGGYTGGGTAGTNIVNAVGGAFVSADSGRRVDVAAFSSFVTLIESGTRARVSDLNITGATISAAGTVSQATAGIPRSVEISWSNGALLEQNLAPDKAFPPPALLFSGVMNDVLFGEGEDGIIYVSDSGFIGSFPPSNALFAPGRGIKYLPTLEAVIIRFERNTIGALYYVGGIPALEYQTIIRHQGIKYPQNAGLGYKGRVLAWLGRPTVVDDHTLEPDPRYADDVLPEFAGWDAQQTAAVPICPGYDAKGNYECWALAKRVMSLHVPDSEWCAPVDLTGKISGDIVEMLPTEHTLYLSCVNLTNDGFVFYEYDAGTGSVMVVQTDEVIGAGYGDTVNELMAQVRVDSVDHHVKLEVLTNYNAADAQQVTVFDKVPANTGTVQLPTDDMRPNILNVRQHSMRFTLQSNGGDCGPDWARTKGSTSEVV